MTPNHSKNAFNIRLLEDEMVRELAVESGFQAREPKKIFPVNFMHALLEMSVESSPSYNDLAARMERDTGISVSRQAICSRVGDSCVRFSEKVLAKTISARLAHAPAIREYACGRYQRVLVQDSTVVKLPLRLFDTFSGVSNAHASVCNARIQAVYDLMADEFTAFSIDSYTKNDRAAAPELDIQKGDLALRDRGYLANDEIQRHINAGADCIYRHKHKTIYRHPQTHEPLDLQAMLRECGRLDIDVLLNNKAKTPVRLVAAPVDEETANLRRMKAKRETKGRNPSKGTLELMGWSIFITTIPREKAAFDELLALYGLRWRIENIFKTWKSNMSFSAIHNVSENQLRTILIARLCMLVTVFHRIFAPLRPRIVEYFSKHLSMMKLLRYLQVNPGLIAQILRVEQFTPRDPLLLAIARYCVYDSRKIRKNFAQIQEQTFACS